MHAAIKLAQAAKQGIQDNPFADFSIALYNLVDDNIVEAESLYNKLASTCTSVWLLQDAVSDVADFLTIQPSHNVAQRVLAQLQARVIEFKQ
jgi:hypothetical protein